MHKIVVPTDFSDNAHNAVKYAAAIAKKNGARLYLLHVIEPLADYIRQPYPLREKLQEEIARNRTTDLKDLQKYIGGTYPGITTETFLAKGTIPNSIITYCETLNADLIIMGTRGASGLREIFMGSVTAATIGKAKFPVLAIPDEYVAEIPHNILFATIHFEDNKSILSVITGLAALFNATLHVAVFADTDKSATYEYVYNAVHLDKYVSRLQSYFPGITIRGELLKGQDFEDTINEYHKRNEVGIIAMIAYPKSFWEKFLMKSMSKKMAFHSKIPVLVVPGKL